MGVRDESEQMARCLVIDELHESYAEIFERANIRTDYRPDIGRDEFLSIVRQYDGVVLRSKFRFDADLLGRCAHLRYIARAGSGVEHIDRAAARKHGIQVLSAPEGNADSVGEHAVGLLLALLNKISSSHAEVKAGRWRRESNRGIELGGKTVAIVGYGHTGPAFAKRLSGFGCHVLAYDKYRTGYADGYAQESDMETIFLQADIVSFHLPLTEETRRLADLPYLQHFAKPVFVVNTSRGIVLPTEDLLAAIESGHVRGAALDVLDNETLDAYSLEAKLAFDRLLRLPQVIVTPHVAGLTAESNVRINEVLARKIRQALTVTGVQD